MTFMLPVPIIRHLSKFLKGQMQSLSKFTATCEVCKLHSKKVKPSYHHHHHHHHGNLYGALTPKDSVVPYRNITINAIKQEKCRLSMHINYSDMSVSCLYTYVKHFKYIFILHATIRWSSMANHQLV